MQYSFQGSRWWKFDFHTHTPASNDFGRGDENYMQITPEQWLQSAMEAGLDCVAVTDHNSGAWIDKLKEAYQLLNDSEEKPDWFKELRIFSGVELTVADSAARVHLLAIFDPSRTSANITSFLGSCGIQDNFGDDKETSTKTSFAETVNKIIEIGGIPIPAHIDGAKGLLHGKDSINPEIKNSLKNIEAAEFCNLHAFDAANAELKKEIDKLAKLSGSDAHKHEDIGKHFSWLKMSLPLTIDGLKLALFDHGFSVLNQEEDPNRYPNIYLKKLSISMMNHCGRPLEKPLSLDFHPLFNALIGGRGAGKSTAIESIRIAMRKDLQLEKQAPRLYSALTDFKKHEREKGVMLDKTEILLELSRRNEDYRLRWRFDGSGNVLEKLQNGVWEKCEEGDLQERFPCQIYSQKQINEMSSHPHALLEIIDRSSLVKKSEWNLRMQDLQEQVYSLLQRQRNLGSLLLNEENLKIQLQDVKNDLSQYEEKGHGEILKAYQTFRQQENSLPEENKLESFAQHIEELKNVISLPDFSDHLFDFSKIENSQLKEIYKTTQQKIQEVVDGLLQKAGDLRKINDEFKIAINSSEWAKKKLVNSQRYEKLVTEYEERKNQLSLSVYTDWVEKRNRLTNELKQINNYRLEFKNNEKRIEDLFKEIIAMRRELKDKRQKFIDSVISKNKYVRMKLVAYGDVSTLEEDYRSILGLEGNSFESSILDSEANQGILNKLSKWQLSKIEENALLGLIDEIKTITFKVATGENQEYHGKFMSRLKNINENNPAVFDKLSLWWPEDLLKVEYSKDEKSNKFEDLERGSAGQKAAAILAFLLSYGEEPLIIDQPEDDLDNALITDLVVNQIHHNKNQRQLIIATHNPNIVVNGDAELIHVFGVKNGLTQLLEQGGLSEDKIRKQVCLIMEGGEKAFESRYQRIISR